MNSLIQTTQQAQDVLRQCHINIYAMSYYSSSRTMVLKNGSIQNLLHNAAQLCLCQMSLFLECLSLFLGCSPSIEDTDQPVHQLGIIQAISITSLDKLGQSRSNPIVPSPGQVNFLAREVKLE